MVGKVEPGLRILRVKSVDQRQQTFKRERGIERDSQIPLPAGFQLYGLFFQIFCGVNQQTPLLEHHSAGIGKLRPMTAAIQQGDIQIAFQLLDHIAQGGRGLIQRLCGGGERSVGI